MTQIELFKEVQDVYEKCKIHFHQIQSLTPNQLNWKPSDAEWSIAECLQHLFTTNEYYLNLFQTLKVNSSELVSDEYEFKHRFIGKYILDGVKPNNSRKIKTSKNFNPSFSSVQKEILVKLTSQTEKIFSSVTNLKNINFMTTSIRSPFLKIIKYNLGDTFLIVFYHMLRHFGQIDRVQKNTNFPKE
ncbi:MAG: DinB family protein [Ignavibacteriaceae bacterium]|nr:DinB family protein [Ignavibacteriaceae bacterium]